MSRKGGVQLPACALQGKGAFFLFLSLLSSWLECRSAGEPSCATASVNMSNMLGL